MPKEELKEVNGDKKINKKMASKVNSSAKKKTKADTKKATAKDKEKDLLKSKKEKVVSNVKKSTKKVKAESEKITKVVKNSKTAKTVKKSKESIKEKVSKTKKVSENKVKESTDLKKNNIVEYYDLPYRYNETVVKILAQTPKRLFVYWEVSEKDRQTYLNAFGEDFFEKTYPVLLVHNEEMNYTFEVPINDFANSWYLDIKDSKTKYTVQLGRKFRNVNEIKAEEEVIEKEHINLQNDFIYITDSNKLEAPNDHILFEKLPSKITYRDVKTGNETDKEVSKILDKLQENYKNADIEDIYKALYGEEISEEILSNPSSGHLSSSNFR